jgi:hypothetical protein
MRTSQGLKENAMSRARIRIQAAVLAFILLPAAVGVLVIHASATCERFVRTYVTKPVRNRVTKQTAEAWAAWRLAHPNWKPNPNSHRPKYVMTREEAVQKVDFACTIEVIPAITDALLVPAEVAPPIVNFPPMGSTQVTFPGEVPPEVAEITPDNEWPALGPLVPPIVGGGPGVVPLGPIVLPQGPVSGEVSEPASLMLTGTGLIFICLVLAAKIRHMEEQPV